MNFSEVPDDLAPLRGSEAAEALLGIATHSPEAAALLIAELDPPDFPPGEQATIFESMKRLGTGDVIRLREDLAGKISTARLAVLSETGSLANPDLVDDYISTLRQEAARRRALEAIGSAARGLGETKAAEVPETLAAVAEQVLSISLAATPSRETRLGDALAAVLKDAETASIGGGGLIGTSSGIDALDRARGGLHPGDVLTIAARTSFGKTAFALGIAVHVVTKAALPVLYLSTEMPARALALRIFSARLGVNSLKVLQGELDKVELARLRREAAALAPAPFYIDDRTPTTVSKIHATAVRVKQRHSGQLGLIVIDYLQQVSIPGRFGSRAEQVGHLARAVKTLATSLSVPVLSLSQLSRRSDHENRPPTLSDLRDSGEIEEASDAVVFLHRDRNAGKDGGDVDVDFVFGKNRGGPCVVWTMTFDRPSTRFVRERRKDRTLSLCPRA
jgi:replicative DNA helicase